MQQQPINEFTHRQPSDNAISSPIFDCPTEEEVELETKTKEEQGLPRLAVPFAFPEAPPFIPGGKPKVDCLDNESESQARARIIITKCIEEGNDNIDLSFLNLETIPSGLLGQLASLIKKPTLECAFLTGDAFMSTEPFLRLVLSCNQLTTIALEIFQLVDLQVLSLCHNNIQEVPEPIHNLTKLRVLNVAGNQLQYLPWGLLKLIEAGTLQHIAVHSNPWVELTAAQGTDIEEWFCDVVDGLFFVKNNRKTSDHPTSPQTGRQYSDAEIRAEPEVNENAPILVARGKTRYLDIEGNPIPSRSLRGRSTHLACQYTPSLRELALKGCSNAPHVMEAMEAASEDESQEAQGQRQNLRESSGFGDEMLMSSDTSDNDNDSSSNTPDTESDNDDRFSIPDTIVPLLNRAKYAREVGGHTCSVCGRSFVIPRVEWVEWWDCSPQESCMKIKRKPERPLFPLPFLRKGCSWLCTPKSQRTTTDDAGNVKKPKSGRNYAHS